MTVTVGMSLDSCPCCAWPELFSVAGTIPFFAVPTSRLRYNPHARPHVWASGPSSSCTCVDHDEVAHDDGDGDGGDDVVVLFLVFGVFFSATCPKATITKEHHKCCGELD